MAKKSSSPKQQRPAPTKTSRPAPVRTVPVQAAPHSKTLAKGQPRPKKRG